MFQAAAMLKPPPAGRPPRHSTWPAPRQSPSPPASPHRHTANATVNLPGEATGFLGLSAHGKPQRPMQRAVHALHQVGHPLGRLRRELSSHFEVGGVEVAQQSAGAGPAWLGGCGHGRLWLRRASHGLMRNARL